MNNAELLQYRNTLLSAGIGYRRVQRHVRELQDHYDDLWQQAMLRGLTGDAIAHEARAALGDLTLLAQQMTASVRKSLWHRYPFWLIVLLPALAYVLLFLPVVLLIMLPVLLAEQAFTSAAVRDVFLSSPLMDFVIWQQTWVMLPACACALVLFSIRNRLPRNHVIAGVLLLCLLGSGMRLTLEVPDPLAGTQGMVGLYFAYDVVPAFHMQPEVVANSWRLVLNVAIAGAFAAYCITRERRMGHAGRGVGWLAKLQVNGYTLQEQDQ